MNDYVAHVLVALAVGASVFAAWHSIRGLRFSNPLFYVVTAAEVGLIIALIVGIVMAVRGGGEGDPVLFWSYFATTLMIAPVAIAWGIGDKSRWGTGVVAIAMLTVAVLVVRLQQIWQGHG